MQIPILVLAAAAAPSPLSAAELNIEITISFFEQEPQRRIVSCGEREGTHTILVHGHSGPAEQQQATITTRLAPAGTTCFIRIAPPHAAQTSDIDWFLPSWAMEAPSEYERQFEFQVSTEQADSAQLWTRRMDWSNAARQPMNELFPIGTIVLAAKTS